jgi:hypothetical protein
MVLLLRWFVKVNHSFETPPAAAPQDKHAKTLRGIARSFIVIPAPFDKLRSGVDVDV